MRTWCSAIVSVAALGCFTAASVGAKAATGAMAQWSTPSGVTFKDVIDKDAKFLWRYFATTSGKPLYMFGGEGDKGAGSCSGSCAQEFSPYLAPASATASGDWSLVRSGQTRRQWAFRGHPLYVFNGKDPVPDTFVYYTDKTVVLDPRMMDPGSKLFSPRRGWRRAAFMPEKITQVPSDLQLRNLTSANGYGFVQKSTGMPLYMLRTEPKNLRAWTPMYAPDLAGRVGAFSIIVRKDGKRQWAYKGEALYSYSGDYSGDDLNGLAAQPDAHVALAYQNFMPAAVHIGFMRFHRPMLVTSVGLTLYGQSVGAGFGYVSSGVATRGCVDDCLRTWKPLLAGPHDVASGFWTIQERADGSRQWAYKGGPLYTYIGDKHFGDTEGDNRQVIVYGDPNGKNYDLVTLAGGNRGPDFRPYAGAGFHWHLISF